MHNDLCGYFWKKVLKQQKNITLHAVSSIYGRKQRKDEPYYGTYDCWMYRIHGEEKCSGRITLPEHFNYVVSLFLAGSLWYICSRLSRQALCICGEDRNRISGGDSSVVVHVCENLLWDRKE